jgi:hypothetical protein
MYQLVAVAALAAGLVGFWLATKWAASRSSARRATAVLAAIGTATPEGKIGQE